MSRNLWSDRPLGVKLSALIGAAAVSLGVFAVIAVGALRDAGDRSSELLAANRATGAALEADMMHDAVRADVLQALLSGTGPAYTSALADLDEHSATLRAALAEVRGAELGAPVDAAVAGVSGAVDAYLTSAGRLARQAGQDQHAAEAGYPDFLTAFTGLEKALPTVGDAVGAVADGAVRRSDEGRSSAITEFILVALIGIAVLSGLGWVVTRSVVVPLRRVGVVVAGLARGDLRGSTGVTSTDEVGRIATALEESMGTVRAVLSTIGDSATTLAAATEELSATAADMSRIAEESAAQSGLVATAAGQVSGNVQTVAAGTGELGTSIRDIAQNATDVARIAGQAVGAAEDATATVGRLGDSSREIGNVVKAITAIAEQTHLLALNATIEAARAGAAGKGFAVVANEVKELAQETATATRDITVRVEGIQAGTAGAVRAIAEMAGIIARIDDAQSTIAAAVEEQTATAGEMGRNVREAATGVDQIAGSITSVADATGTTTRAMADAQQAIDEVARLAAGLSSSVARFRY
jgi:methyl-accepting chemotaxis protein